MWWTLYRLALLPKQQSQEIRQREFILNCILISMLVMVFVSVAAATFDIYHTAGASEHAFPMQTLLFGFAVLLFWIISRMGWPLLSSALLLLSTGLLAGNLVLKWGFNMTSAELLYCMMVAVAGVLLTPGKALIYNVTAIMAFLVVCSLQTLGILHPDVSWLDEAPHIADAVGYASVFSVVSLVSWLGNNEARRHYKLAKASEAALAIERDSLESKVRQRTRELEDTQALRITELQHFAEFGRISASLLHEISSPLTAASINLDRVDGSHLELVTQAKRNLDQLTKYVEANRKQLYFGSKVKMFSVKSELQDIAKILSPIARTRGIRIVLDVPTGLKISGDPIKFSQIMCNLTANAMDSYDIFEASISKHKLIVISAASGDRWLEVKVTDHGSGISPENIKHIFEPFYTTKGSSKRGLGLGLSVVKQYMHSDFGGNISVSSTPAKGTVFTLYFKNS